MNSIEIYNSGEIELKVSVEDETIWLNQKQLVELFDVTKQNISLHINNIFKEGELNKNSTVKFFLTVQNEGKREVKRNLEHYNLDMIISLGYRVNSKKATQFRQWATKILKNYISNGYAINEQKITHQRLLSLEEDMATLKSKINNNTLEIKQGIFYDGEVFDAYNFVSDIIKSAKNSIKIIDNYIDDSVLTHLSKNQNVKTTIYTSSISKQLKLDIEKYNKQYNKIELKLFKDSHDRFIIIDEEVVYHIGASLKDLGKNGLHFQRWIKV